MVSAVRMYEQETLEVGVTSREERLPAVGRSACGPGGRVRACLDEEPAQNHVVRLCGTWNQSEGRAMAQRRNDGVRPSACSSR